VGGGKSLLVQPFAVKNSFSALIKLKLLTS